MSRRRKKNPLLTRIILISVAAHVIILPIAAHFGAFEKIKEKVGMSKVTLVPIAKAQKEKPEPPQKKEKPKVKTSKVAKSGSKHSGPVRANPNLQKVVASNSPGGEGDGPAIEQGTRTDAGKLPVDTGNGNGTKTTDTGVGNKTEENHAPPVTTTNTTPPPVTPPVVRPDPVKPKHVPVYAEPEVDYNPQPAIPEDLRAEPLEKDFVAIFTVGPDGKPTDVKMTKSTGISELDEVALKTAKTWRFKPATLDGVGTEGKVKLTIQFRVE